MTREGTGKFLEPILKKKLEQAKRYKKIIREYEQQALLALGSIYGIELLLDNAQECRDRLFKIWKDEYYTLYKKRISEDVLKGLLLIEILYVPMH